MIRPRTKSPVAPARRTDHGPTGTGIALMIIAMGLLPVGDTLAKLLTGVMPSTEVVLWRFGFQSATLAAMALLLRHRLRGAMFSPVLVLSGLCSVVTMAGLVGAFAVMPIATAIAIFFVEPLILVLLAAPLLGEKIGPRRYAAVAVGFVGALVVIRPGFEGFTPAALLPLLAATGYALNAVILRSASASRSALTIQTGATLYAALIALLLFGAMALMGGAGLAAPRAPGWVWGMLPLAGLVSAVTFLLIAEAFRRSEAGLLAPFQYLEIVGAVALGYLVFGDLPDATTALGTAIILGSGAYVVHRERMAARQGRGTGPALAGQG
ncbi:DMT family transporter [Limimaricola litoreus]|uniref:DMT family transporter n=1 Tax=Limimaricola litoreus TaxID=2955316 RepID=A0A9X2JR80_9RHOB|nr:DMT family transporter [Limimaricola litoreus]MCP1170699.1 DMT family transporter [Limimaricola litoreus]